MDSNPKTQPNDPEAASLLASVGKKIRPRLGMMVALLAVAFAYFWRLDRPLLWVDEAQTGIAARNILRFGYPTAFDGRNAAVVDSGRTLSRNLVFKQIPWAHHYLGAASVALFGDSEFGLRALFAAVGLLAFFPIYAVLKTRLKFPSLVTVLILISPQMVLFQRNARYYSLLILFYAVLLWHVANDSSKRTVRIITAILLFILLFHTHPHVAICCSLSVLIFCGLYRRNRLGEYLIAAGVGFLSWFVWHQALGPLLGHPMLPLSFITKDFLVWLEQLSTGLLATVVDLDAIACVPILAWFAGLGWLLVRERETLRRAAQEPVARFLVITVLIHAVVTAATFGYETKTDRFCLLRYLCPVLLAALVLLFLLLNAVVKQRGFYLLAAVMIVICNPLTLSFWARPLGRKVPVSWAIPVYAEIFRPQTEAWDGAIARLRDGTAVNSSEDRSIMALPPWTQEVAIYYLGDRYFVPPLFEPGATEPLRPVREILGGQRYDQAIARPAWFLDSYGFFPNPPPGYEIVSEIPSHRQRPDDGSRPELLRHSFPDYGVAKSIKVYRRRP